MQEQLQDFGRGGGGVRVKDEAHSCTHARFPLFLKCEGAPKGPDTQPTICKWLISILVDIVVKMQQFSSFFLANSHLFDKRCWYLGMSVKLRNK